MNAEQSRLKTSGWKKWGPYVSDRQWGTVREDYSKDGDAWNYITHDMARSKAYRWGEEGIGGICDNDQLLCFAIALWNKKDPILKERYFGLSNTEGNHGEDVKELYYYLDNTPTHSYMKMLYKYPQQAYPYQWLISENNRRGRNNPEFELIDTGIFNNNEYFDVFVEYAKQDKDDIFIKVSINNRSDKEASLNILPTVWFRNTWTLGYEDYKPKLSYISNTIKIQHEKLGDLYLISENNAPALFTDNETNAPKLYQYDDGKKYYKDGINDYLLHNADTVNPDNKGTKAAFNYDLTIPAKGEYILKLRLSADSNACFDGFDELFSKRKAEADDFYNQIQSEKEDIDKSLIQRQAFAGMLWSKQFYYYDVHQWLHGDPALPAPLIERLNGRNAKWPHFNNRGDIISMPDKWEFPWFAAWDLAFHCIPLASVDMAFAKNQLTLLIRDWYMHPNGQLPAYEWDFSDANPPVHAMATWKIYQLDKAANNGEGDIYFLERIFHKLMLNFTWWVNRKDSSGNNIFEGGFLGLDNIGVFDRNTKFSNGETLEQVDGTSWMAMYSLNLLRIAAELAGKNKAYEDIASKFFEHFIYIAAAMASLGNSTTGLWDDEDGFFYDQLKFANGSSEKMRVRSIVGLTPLFAIEVIDETAINNNPIFRGRMNWFTENRPDLANLVSRWNEKSTNGKHLVSLLRGFRMKGILKYMLDENEFLSDYGIRSVSKYHLKNPYQVNVNGFDYCIKYLPAESDSGVFGGNSNWRGPVWIPLNYLIIESLNKYYEYYGDDFKVECPTNSGNMMNLKEVANEIYRRISAIFLKDVKGKRPVFGKNDKMQTDPAFSDHILFHEYFNGDNGHGLGASHQTGWTGLIANCLYHQ
ncbi:MGH1-like glycoside hydrolase domain-containing protein [Mucilaginibacter segetis]|uniref:Glucosidase n=1 Tax=Mucilaginibacter segetis TaxID=2793071 RepID=A0A934UM70_9SPHI|nr:glucosidase [Mucilaginibacter segetis]MBK0379104.1 glucosidase [Mucilaginibacter segetis]